MKPAIFTRGLMSQLEVIHAVMLRETRTRFGSHKLGYAWALLEPLITVVTFYFLLAFANRPAPDGMSMVGFIGTGIIPYVLFNNSAIRVADSIKGNRGLLFYPHVQPLDLVYARCLLEFITYVAVFVVLMGGTALYEQSLNIDSSLRVLAGLCLASLLGSTFGLILCATSVLSNFVDRARGPLLRPMFWVSGIFFTANQLPDRPRDLALFNPLLHCSELVRDGWYPSYTAHHASPGYTIAYILVFAAIGLSLERAVRYRIEVG